MFSSRQTPTPTPSPLRSVSAWLQRAETMMQTPLFHHHSRGGWNPRSAPPKRAPSYHIRRVRARCRRRGGVRRLCKRVGVESSWSSSQPDTDRPRERTIPRPALLTQLCPLEVMRVNRGSQRARTRANLSVNTDLLDL